MKFNIAADVPATRNSYYPKYLLFYNVNGSVLLPRRLCGQPACDIIVELGAAVPVAKKHETIADAMGEMPSRSPELAHIFFRMLSEPEQHLSGWYDFLTVAFWHFVKLYQSRLPNLFAATVDLRSHEPTRIQFEEYWKGYFGYAIKPVELNCGSRGYEFHQALDTTYRVANRLMTDWFRSHYWWFYWTYNHAADH